MYFFAIIVTFVVALICFEKGRADARTKFYRENKELYEEYQKYFKY